MTIQTTLISALVGTALMLGVACGGSSKPISVIPGTDTRILHLATGNYTEIHIQAEVRFGGELTPASCTAFKGLDAQDIIDTLNAQPGGRTWEKPVIQEANPDDDLRQMELILEECDRLTK